MNKKELRKEILAYRSGLSRQVCLEKSKVIAEKVIKSKEFQKSNRILLYAPIRNEVETQEIYQEAKRLGKEIYLPRILGKEMEFYLVDGETEFETSAYGICEPKPESTTRLELKEEDVILVVLPGAVFDREGNRIGYGGGYYDKYLSRLIEVVPQEQVCKVAVAYACQIVETGKIINEEHDIKADYVITEEMDESISD